MWLSSSRSSGCCRDLRQWTIHTVACVPRVRPGEEVYRAVRTDRALVADEIVTLGHPAAQRLRR